MSSNTNNKTTTSLEEIDQNTAYVPIKGSTALEGVGTNPTGKKFDGKTARADQKGSSALEGVGSNPMAMQSDQSRGNKQISL
ncbi:2289_t:CDS:2 [Acaulospora colombiana]|uniref:2289_t:CDS:1 n=1 Tax=Acaulospora colombiana TaxID=27376 RepID=A0ACA9LH51_9GLOM|nr:2289_t:CDS:2 [Acaulospora colombiana]